MSDFAESESFVTRKKPECHTNNTSGGTPQEKREHEIIMHPLKVGKSFRSQ